VRFHDFHLAGYTVSDFGGTIVLDLVYDYPDRPSETSRIKFSDVAAYHFVHTGGAIITEIEEIRVPQLLKQVGDQLAEWSRMHGLLHWSDDRDQYAATLQQKGYRAWTIESAVGFEGFVIAKSVGDA
jgi:hypothetical protein